MWRAVRPLPQAPLSRPPPPAPAEFWAWLLPYNAVIDVCLLALLLVRSRRANIALLAALIVLFLVPYWDQGAIDRLATGIWGY